MSIQSPIRRVSQTQTRLSSSSYCHSPRAHRGVRPHFRWLATQPQEPPTSSDPPTNPSSSQSISSSSTNDSPESRTTSPSLSRLTPAPRPSQADSSKPFSYKSHITFNPDHSFETILPRLPQKFGSNQRLTVPDETRALLEEVVGTFRAPIRYAFAYGSGVFKQKGYDKNSSVSDAQISEL